MTLGLIIVSTVLLICSGGVGVSAYMYREKVSTMHGMLFSMSMAMGMGLFTGTLGGILFQENLLLSTVIGMGAGFIVGIAIGSLFSFLAILEGMLSGIMAGMMGAMLGEMILPSDWDKTIMIMFTIAMSVCLLIIFEIFSYVEYGGGWIQAYQNPFIMGLLFVVLCLVLFSLAPFFPEMAYHTHH